MRKILEAQEQSSAQKLQSEKAREAMKKIQAAQNDMDRQVILYESLLVLGFVELTFAFLRNFCQNAHFKFVLIRNNVLQLLQTKRKARICDVNGVK